MNRLQWLLLALAVAAAAILVASWDRGVDDGAGSHAGPTASEPDLFMENAVISQFDAIGNLRYRMRAQRISHFADRRVTRLLAPAMQLQRSAGPPWTARAAQGEIDYTDPGGSLFDATIAAPATTPNPAGATASATASETASESASETVRLTRDVVLSRNDGAHFVVLTTERLTLLPSLRTAYTDATVLIVTDTGRTIAHGMAGELETGRLQLYSAPRQRVTTIVNPPKQ